MTAPHALKSGAVVALALAIVGLTGCAGAGKPPSTTLVGGASSAAPTPAPGYDWFFHTDGSEARLAYGLAESDDVPLVLACRQGSGRLELSATAPAGARAEIHIESGGEAQRFPARAEPSQLHEGVFLVAEADSDAPALQRFRSTGWLAVRHGDERRMMAPQPGSVGGIQRFFGKCG